MLFIKVVHLNVLSALTIKDNSCSIIAHAWVIHEVKTTFTMIMCVDPQVREQSCFVTFTVVSADAGQDTE